MLFRFLIIVSLLLASVEGAPINIRRHDPWTKHTIPADIGTRVVSRTRGCIIGQDNCFLCTEHCKGLEDYGLDGIFPPMIPWLKVITEIVTFITIIIFAPERFTDDICEAMFDTICDTICRHLMKDKSRRNDEDKETSDKPIVDGILPPMIPWKEDLTYIVVFTIIIFLLATFIDAICYIRRHLMKDKSRRNDEDKETSDKPIGKHENKLIIGNGEAARGPMAEKSDNLKNTDINKQWMRDKIAKFEACQKVINDSDRTHENKLIIGNGEAARGPMAEKSDNLKNTDISKQWMRDKIAKFEARQKVINDSDRKHENKLIIGNGEAARGPMAEKSDNLKNTHINKQWMRDKIAKFEARQKVINDSDRKHENKLIIGNGEAARGPMAEKSDNLKNTDINKQWIRDKIAKFEAHQKVIIDSDKPRPVSRITPQVSDICVDCKTCLSQTYSCCEPTINMGSSQRRLYLSKKRQITGSVSVLPH